MFRLSIIFSFLCIAHSQHINFETDWEFFSSPTQSFYIFDSIEIDGETALGDGWAPSETLASVCTDNPYSCDVLGAFLGDICVGWAYIDSEGFTTLPIMGYFDQPNNEELSNYCLEGDTPAIKIYDSSSGAILDLVVSDMVPEWSEGMIYQIQNISFANNGIISDVTEWTYFQSSNQAFYIFENIIIDNIDLEELDVIGAFKDDLCVGWINYDLGGFTSVPVMGIEPNLYPNYMIDGEIPYFKFFDYSEGVYYNIIPSEELLGWSSNGYFVISGNSTASPVIVEGCTDSDACNYNSNANEDDDSCLYNDCLGECGGIAELDECGVCDGDDTTCLASISFGNFDPLGTIEIIYEFGGPVAGFQFDVTGLALIGGSGGAASDAGMTVSVGGSTVIGFSFDNTEIPSGNGLLTILEFSDVMEGVSELSLGMFGAVTDAATNIYETSAYGYINHGEPDCLENYYGDAFIDICGECVLGDTNPDDCLSSELAVPLDLYLSQNYPNPFNPTSKIDYGIPANDHVTISLYDLNGRKLKTLVDRFHTMGHYSLGLTSHGLNSGFYLVKILSSNSAQTIKITVIK